MQQGLQDNKSGRRQDHPCEIEAFRAQRLQDPGNHQRTETALSVVARAFRRSLRLALPWL